MVDCPLHATRCGAVKLTNAAVVGGVGVGVAVGASVGGGVLGAGVAVGPALTEGFAWTPTTGVVGLRRSSNTTRSPSSTTTTPAAIASMLAPRCARIRRRWRSVGLVVLLTSA